MSKHSPGTWLTEGATVYALNESGSNRFCAHVQPGFVSQHRDHAERTGDDELQAVARMMAAAPELLEAAQELINAFNFRAAAIVSFDGDDRVEFANNLMFKAVDKATAVITKATGGQP